jgi:hypothetical protein
MGSTALTGRSRAPGHDAASNSRPSGPPVVKHSRPSARPLAALSLALLLTLGAPPVHAAEAPSPSGDGGEAAADPFIPLDPLAISLISGGKVQGSLIVSASLEVLDPARRSEIEKKMPRLHDAYMREMIAFGETRTRVDRPVDVTALGNALQRATDRQLGGGAASVLIMFATVRKA